MSLGDLTDLGPWRPGETARYVACLRHRGPLDRMDDFDRACDIAEGCGRCRVQYRPTEGATT